MKASIPGEYLKKASQLMREIAKKERGMGESEYKILGLRCKLSEACEIESFAKSQGLTVSDLLRNSIKTHLAKIRLTEELTS